MGTKAEELGTEIREDMEKLRNDAMRLRDEVRVQIHLGTMDARKNLDRLEGELQRAEQDLDRNASQASRKVVGEWKRLCNAFEAMRAELKKPAST